MSTARRNLLGGVAALAAAPVRASAVTWLSANVEMIRLAKGVIEAEVASDASYEVPARTLEEEKVREPKRERLLIAISDQA